MLPDERSERKMTPRNEDTFADLNPEFYDSIIFPVSVNVLKSLARQGVVKQGPCTCRAKRYVGTFKSRVSIYITLW